MIDLKITSNLRDVQAAVKAHVAEQQKAIVRALNKTAEQARTAASKEVRAVGYNIKANVIKKSFSVQRASGKNLVVVLKATGAPIGLINYGARQTKGGVSVNVLNGRKTLDHAFIRTMKNGHTGVFVRTGAAIAHSPRSVTHRIGKNGRLIKSVKDKRSTAGMPHNAGSAHRKTPNLPIKELYGPSIPTAVANTAVMNAIMKLIQTQFPKILAAELNFIQLKK